MAGSSGGERQGDREAIDRVTRRMVDDGVPTDKAKQMARESMERADRQLREKGKR